MLTRKGKHYSLEASYVIAADGHKGFIRNKLGISTSGIGHLHTVRSVLFKASLDHHLEKGYRQFQIQQPGLEGFMSTFGDGRWVLIVHDDKDVTLEEQREWVLKAVRERDLDFDIIVSGRWELKGVVADTFQSGRIFLTGDAAHTLPPTRGGFGANTGIHDAHNLAWKLASVHSGKSEPKLLDTYSTERQPVGWLWHQQAFARPDYAQFVKGEAPKVDIYADSAVEFGQI